MKISITLALIGSLAVSRAQALEDQDPPPKAGYTKENSPTCFLGCAGYAPTYCETPWESCNPAFPAANGWKIKSFCQKSCYVPPDPCTPNPCKNGGVCYNGACYCPSGCSGTYCESCAGSCNPNPCKNDGTCVDGSCQCKTGCSGTYCETCAGNWENWSSWSNCNAKCPNKSGKITRTRKCDNPALGCAGNANEEKSCTIQCDEYYCGDLKSVTLGSTKCEGSSGQESWDTNGWNNGENCRAKCLELVKTMGDGCCEARHRNNFSATWCMYRKAVGINGGFADSKAVKCYKK